MGSVKTITYGNNIEIFEYEFEPHPHERRSKRKDREKLTDEEKFERRKANVVQSKRNFVRLVKANLEDGNPPFLISMTYVENMQDIKQGYKDFGAFIQKLRYRFGKEFRYIGAPEFQTRGAVHFHILAWNLPITPREERRERILAGYWDHGFVDVRATDGDDRLSGYLAKYMAKAFIDKRLINQKAYIASRNVRRPEVSIGGVMNLYMEYLRENAEAVKEQDRKYRTKWRGECHHRLFKMNK